MAKNILLLFLSTVQITPTGEINEAHYENISGEKTQTTNESAVRYLLQKTPLDKIFIFASKAVQSNIVDRNGKLYCDANNQPQTHLDFFLERMKKFCAEVDYSIYSYDENFSTDAKLADDAKLRYVADMAGRIQDYVAQVADEVFLHVDLTGGMRDVNMMMLDLTRLLEYSGLKIGNLIYSNYNREKKIGRVELLTNVYDLFQLIAGVEEFVNFGSVKALIGDNGYYKGKKISAALKKLLVAMENFSSAIKLCHYGQFKDAIINLHDAARDFKPATNDVQDILMSRLIDKIRKDYHHLIVNRDLDDVEVIHWCLQHDYLQQALTLYTERIPEYLGEKIIVTPENIAKKIAELIKDDRRNFFYYLLNVYSPSVDHTYKALKFYCNAIKTETIGKKDIDVDAWLAKLNANFEPTKNSLSDELRLRAQLETFNKLRQAPQLLCDLSSPELNPIRKIIDELSDELITKEYGKERRKIIFDFVNRIKNENFTNYFPGVVFAKNIYEKYPRAFQIYESLFDEVFTVKIPEEKFLCIMENYFRIRDERHLSNHARKDLSEFKTADELRKFLSDSLEEIKRNLPAR